MHDFSRAADFFKDLFLITQCPVCMKETSKGGICEECRRALENSQLDEKKYNIDVYGYTVVCRSVFSYEYEQVKSLIRHLKVNSDKRTFAYCAAFLAGEIRNLGFDGDAVLTYVPRSSEGLRENGFDQSEYLVRSLSDILPFTSRKILLKRIRNSKAQKSLSGKERKDNVKGKFRALKTAASPKNIVIIDDVFTTGASMRECVAVLRECYPQTNIFSVTVAKNPKTAYDSVKR